MILYDTKYLQLKKTPAKNGSDWVYAHRPNAKDVIVILPIIEKTKTLFIIEERPPIKAENKGIYTVGLPAGLVGDVRENETLIESAVTELREETGLDAEKVEIIAGNIASSAGCVSETYTIACAYINEYEIKSEPSDDGGVIIRREVVNICDIDSKLREYISKKYVLTSQMLSALYYLKEIQS